MSGIQNYNCMVIEENDQCPLIFAGLKFQGQKVFFKSISKLSQNHIIYNLLKLRITYSDALTICR